MIIISETHLAIWLIIAVAFSSFHAMAWVTIENELTEKELPLSDVGMVYLVSALFWCILTIIEIYQIRICLATTYNCNITSVKYIQLVLVIAGITLLKFLNGKIARLLLRWLRGKKSLFGFKELLYEIRAYKQVIVEMMKEDDEDDDDDEKPNSSNIIS